MIQQLFYLIKRKRNFIVYMSIRVLIMILSLITNIFIVRKLSVNDYGIFSIALMINGLVTTFGFSWSSSSILYYGSREKEERGNMNRTFWSRNIIIFFSLFITTLIFLLFKQQINLYIGRDVVFLVLIWLYVSVAEDYLNQYFLAIKKQMLSSLLSLTAKISYLILIFLVPLNVNTLILINILSHATVLLYIFAIKNKDIGKFEFDKTWFKEILSFSLWQLFGFAGLYLINFGDTVVIKYFMTNIEVGIYNAPYNLFNAVAGFASIIANYYASSVTTYFSKKDHKSIKTFFYRDRFYIIFISTAIHMLLFIFARPIILTIYGNKYIESINILRILLIGSMFRYLGIFYTLYFNTNGKYRFQQSLNIFRAILNILLNIFFIQVLGLIGVAVGTTAAYLITFLISLFYSEKNLKLLASGTEE